jgi:hypothetical protein
MEPTGFDPQTMVLAPPHLKKVIYLDQFAISEMVKAIDTRSKAHARVNPIWRRVFEVLERVCKLQLVVCPRPSVSALFLPESAREHRMKGHASPSTNVRETPASSTEAMPSFSARQNDGVQAHRISTRRTRRVRESD